MILSLVNIKGSFVFPGAYKPSFLLLLLLSLNFQKTTAQWEYHFYTDTEKKEFESLKYTGSADLFALNYTAGIADISGLEDARRSVDLFIAQKKAEHLKFQKSRQVQKLVLDIYNRFLKRYEVNADVSRMFRYGNFNEYTATFLYAHILEQLGVSFTVEQNLFFPFISVVRGEDTTEIKITSLDYSEVMLKGEKEEYIRFWIKSGRSTLSRWHELGTDDLFRELSNQWHTISSRDLAGLQYLNIFRRDYRLGAYMRSLKALRLSRDIYSTPETNYFSLLAFQQLEHEKNRYSWTHLLCQKLIFHNAFDRDKLIGQFYTVCYRNLFSSNQTKSMDTILNCLNAGLIEDTALLDKLKGLYYSMLGEYYHKKGEYRISLLHLEKALELSPEDVGFQYEFYVTVRNYCTELAQQPQRWNLSELEFLWGLEKLDGDRNYLELIAETTRKLVNNNLLLESWNAAQLDSMGSYVLEKVKAIAPEKELNSTIADIYLDLAYAWIKLEKKDRANEIIEEAFEKFPYNSRVAAAHKFYAGND